MGDFVRHRSDPLHRILLADAAGTALGEIWINASFRREERYPEHLRHERGAASRVVVDVRDGYTVGGMGGGLGEPLDEWHEALVKGLREQQGAPAGEGVVGFDDPSFPAACAKWIASETGHVASFGPTSLG